MSIEERYISLTNIIESSNDPRKDDIHRLLKYLEENTDWLKAPASTRFHGSHEGGLIEHSVNVAELCIKFKKLLAPEIDITSAVIIGLLHDVGKVGLYIQKEPTEKQLQYGYPGSIVYNDKILNKHEIRSLQIIGEYTNLTEDEFLAIQYHNSPWDGNRDCAFYKCKLMTILQMADYYSVLYCEKGGAKNE